MYEKVGRMSSIAIWGIKGNNCFLKKLEVHVNLWFTGPKVKVKDYIEIGLKFKINDTKKLYIYFPFHLTERDIEDKVSKLKNDLQLTSALFNSLITSMKTPIDGQFIEVNLKNTEKLILIELNKNDSIKIKNFTTDDNFKYSIIEIILPKLNNEHCQNEENSQDKIIVSDEEKGYIRLRINKFDSNSGMFERVERGFLDSLLTEETILEFNINAPRKLPSEICNKIANISFNKVHMFVLLEDFAKIEFCNNEINDSRILEKNIWNKYLNISNDEKSIRKVIAYHWKKQVNDNIKEYNFFVKISKSNNNLWLAILVILFLSILSGIIANSTIAIPTLVIILILIIIILAQKGE